MSTTPLTNAALGEALGVTHATVSRIRSGDRNPSTELMVKLAKLIDWPLDAQVELKWKSRPGNGETPYSVALREREDQIAEALAKRDG